MTKESPFPLPTDVDSFTDDFISFVQASPTSFHAATRLTEILKASSFTQLSEGDTWVNASPRSFVMVDGAVVAWDVPTGVDTGGDGLGENLRFRIVGSHLDSPSFALKPTPDHVTSDGWGQLEVEPYGGLLYNSWLDRDLGLAGRLVDFEGKTHLVQTGPIMRIPQLAPHVDRAVNTDGLKLDPQKHLKPIWYQADSLPALGYDVDEEGRVDVPSILDIVAALAGLEDSEEIAGFDLFAFDTQAPARIGLGGQFLASSRLDNLSSAYAGLIAFLELAQADLGEKDPATITVYASFDHEEIGSATATGAQGPLLERTLERIAMSLNLGREEFLRIMSRSTLVSADAGQSVHPNYSEKFDPESRPVAGAGPMLKISAKQRYSSYAPVNAIWLQACNAADIPHQVFVSNNSVPAGSTIGPLSATRLGIQVVDVGIPLISMHSAREMCAPIDMWHLKLALASFLAGN